jgi:hypothetical protein
VQLRVPEEPDDRADEDRDPPQADGQEPEALLELGAGILERRELGREAAEALTGIATRRSLIPTLDHGLPFEPFTGTRPQHQLSARAIVP